MTTSSLANSRLPTVSKAALSRDVTRRATLAAEAVVAIQVAAAGATSDLDTLGRLVAAGVGLAVALAAMVVTWTSTGQVRGGAILVLGCLGVVTRAGIGAVHLALTGPSIGALFGTLALVAGIGLLLEGAWILIRSVRGWHRLWAIPLGFLRSSNSSCSRCRARCMERTCPTCPSPL